MKRIVISTGGGDAPGLNAVIYAVVKASLARDWEVYGSRSGYLGLLDTEELVRLDHAKVEDITPTGGTILGSTNKGNPFAMPVENLAGEIQIRDVSDRVMENFGTENAAPLKIIDVKKAERMLAEGQFPPGSMGPKISASIEYIKGGGKEVLITSAEKLRLALIGRSGTRIVRELKKDARR